MSRLWQRGAVIAIGLAWIVMSAADLLSQTPPTGTWEKRTDVPYRVQEISDRVYIYDPVKDSRGETVFIWWLCGCQRWTVERKHRYPDAGREWGSLIYVVAGASEAGGSGTTNRLAVFSP